MLVAEATAAAPTMLVVEDLQWCDPTSYDLFQEVLATIEDTGIFVVVTERSGVREFDDRLPADAIIRLDAFDVARCRELVESITRFPVAANIVSTINSRAGGVPLYKDGKLVGAIGVSGDGVEQDENVADAGAKGYEPPKAIRIDTVTDGGVPYTQ